MCSIYLPTRMRLDKSISSVRKVELDDKIHDMEAMKEHSVHSHKDREPGPKSCTKSSELVKEAPTEPPGDRKEKQSTFDRTSPVCDAAATGKSASPSNLDPDQSKLGGVTKVNSDDVDNLNKQFAKVSLNQKSNTDNLNKQFAEVNLNQKCNSKDTKEKCIAPLLSDDSEDTPDPVDSAAEAKDNIPEESLDLRLGKLDLSDERATYQVEVSAEDGDGEIPSIDGIISMRAEVQCEFCRRQAMMQAAGYPTPVKLIERGSPSLKRKNGDSCQCVGKRVAVEDDETQSSNSYHRLSGGSMLEGGDYERFDYDSGEFRKFKSADRETFRQIVSQPNSQNMGWCQALATQIPQDGWIAPGPPVQPTNFNFSNYRLETLPSVELPNSSTSNPGVIHEVKTKPFNKPSGCNGFIAPPDCRQAGLPPQRPTRQGHFLAGTTHYTQTNAQLQAKDVYSPRPMAPSSEYFIPSPDSTVKSPKPPSPASSIEEVKPLPVQHSPSSFHTSTYSEQHSPASQLGSQYGEVFSPESESRLSESDIEETLSMLKEIDPDHFDNNDLDDVTVVTTTPAAPAVQHPLIDSTTNIPVIVTNSFPVQPNVPPLIFSGCIQVMPALPTRPSRPSLVQGKGGDRFRDIMNSLRPIAPNPPPKIQPAVVPTVTYRPQPPQQPIGDQPRPRVKPRVSVHKVDLQNHKQIQADRKLAGLTNEQLDEIDEDKENALHIHITETNACPYILTTILNRFKNRSESNLEQMINAKNNMGQTPLFLATTVKNPSLMCILLNYKANPNIMRDIQRRGPSGIYQDVQSPLHYAIGSISGEFGKTSEECVKILVSHDSTNLNIINSEGLTALMLVIYKHGKDYSRTNPACLNMIQLLLQYGAEVDTRARGNLTGKTAMHLLVETRNAQLMNDVLNLPELDYMLPTVLNMAAYKGNTCLHLLVASKMNANEIDEIMRLMIKKGANQGLKNDEKLTVNGMKSWRGT